VPFNYLKLRLSIPVPVECGDIIGIQVASPPSTVLQCDSDAGSPWRQNVLVSRRDSWLAAEDTLLMGASVETKWIVDQVCDILAVYTSPVIIYPPPELLKRSSPGIYRY